MGPRRPPLDFFWFIPTYGDGRYLGSETQQRPPEFAYFREIAQAVDRLGYGGVLLPTGQACEESWVTAAGLATATEKLKFLVALRPGVVQPAYAARQTAALDRLSNGRLRLNVVVGGNPVELAGDGVFLPHDQRYEQANEFLTIWQGLVSGERVDFEGKHYRIEKGRLDFPPAQTPPPLYFGGSSEAGIELAAEKTELYLTWGEPLDAVAEKIAAARARATAKGRRLRFGIRLHFIVRETEEEAWAAADRLISRISDEQIEIAYRRFTKEMDSVGQRRMAELHGGRRDRLLVGPNLWAGVGLVRGGAGTALVGTPAQVAARLGEYQALGIDTGDRIRLPASRGGLSRRRAAVSRARHRQPPPPWRQPGDPERVRRRRGGTQAGLRLVTAAHRHLHRPGSTRPHQPASAKHPAAAEAWRAAARREIPLPATGDAARLPLP